MFHGFVKWCVLFSVAAKMGADLFFVEKVVAFLGTILSWFWQIWFQGVGQFGTMYFYDCEFLFN